MSKKAQPANTAVSRSSLLNMHTKFREKQCASSFLHSIVKLKQRLFFSKLLVHVEDNNNSPHGKISSIFISTFWQISRPKLRPMFAIFTHVTKPVRDTICEPGLPVLELGARRNGCIRRLQKSVMHVQSCCFAKLMLFQTCRFFVVLVAVAVAVA